MDEVIELYASVKPYDATYTYSWRSSDPSVATVSGTVPSIDATTGALTHLGAVCAVKPGSATITFTAGGRSASCSVSVVK